MKAPGFGDDRKETMQDLAILAGRNIISENITMKLEEVFPEHLGWFKKLTVTKNHTVILDSAGEHGHITERCNLIKSSIELTKSDYEYEKLQ